MSVFVDTKKITPLVKQLDDSIKQFGLLSECDCDLIEKTRSELNRILDEAKRIKDAREAMLRDAQRSLDMARNTQNSCGMDEGLAMFEKNIQNCCEAKRQADSNYDNIKKLCEEYEERVKDYQNALMVLQSNYAYVANKGGAALTTFLNLIEKKWGESKLSEVGSDTKISIEAKVVKVPDDIYLGTYKVSGAVKSVTIDGNVIEKFAGSCFKNSTIPQKYNMRLENSKATEISLDKVEFVKKVGLTGSITYKKIKGCRSFSSNTKFFSNMDFHFRKLNKNSMTLNNFDDYLLNVLPKKISGKVPCNIPSSANVILEEKDGKGTYLYEQVKYKWRSSDGYMYEFRWHTPTNQAIVNYGDSWVCNRTRRKHTQYYNFVTKTWVDFEHSRTPDTHMQDSGKILTMTGVWTTDDRNSTESKYT